MVDVTIITGSSATVVTSSTASADVTIDTNSLSAGNSIVIDSLKVATGRLSTATGTLNSSVSTLNTTTSSLDTSVTANTADISTLSGIMPSIQVVTGNFSGSITGLTGATGELQDNKIQSTNGFGTGTFVYESGNFRINATGGNKTAFDLVGGKMLVRPKRGVGLHVKSSLNGNVGTRIKSDGPIELAHDIFKNAGVSGGFADNSNHFHDIITINKIEQNKHLYAGGNISGNIENIERLQEKYYAVEDNLVRKISDTDGNTGKAAFLTKHRVTRPLDSSGVAAADSNKFVSGVTLNVTGLENSVHRQANNQVFFSSTPSGHSEIISGDFNFPHGLFQVIILKQE